MFPPRLIMTIKLLFLIAALLTLDQAAKNIFSTYLCNPNIAWSLPIAPAIFYFVWTLIIAALVYTFFLSKKHSQKLFLVLIFSGALSNLIDRIRLGCVVDFIDLGIWPVFNLADIYITIGIIFLIILNLKFQNYVLKSPLRHNPRAHQPSCRSRS